MRDSAITMRVYAILFLIVFFLLRLELSTNKKNKWTISSFYELQP